MRWEKNLSQSFFLGGGGGGGGVKGWEAVKGIKIIMYRKDSCISRTRVYAAPPTFKHDFGKKYKNLKNLKCLILVSTSKSFV